MVDGVIGVNGRLALNPVEVELLEEPENAKTQLLKVLG